MICMFSDRDAKKVLEHVNSQGENVQVINIFPLGSKLAVIYKTVTVKVKEEKEKKEKTQN